MALNSTPRRRFGVALGVVLTGVTAGVLGFAGTASAHTPKVEAYCKGDTTTLKVNLKDYAGSKTLENTVKITDGAKVLEDSSFQAKFVKSFDTSGAEDHTFRVVVTAWDDKKFNVDETLKVEKCVVQSSSSSVPPSESSSVPPSESSTQPPVESSTAAPTSSEVVLPAPTPTTTTTPAPEVEEAALAETGASIGLPLGIAGVLLVGGGIALFIVRKRSKA